MSSEAMRSASRRSESLPGVFQRELHAVPPDWPVIGVGAEAYKALAYLEPSRTVLGVPHPTGSWGRFFALFAADGKLRPEVAGQARQALENAVPTAAWLFPKKIPR